MNITPNNANLHLKHNFQKQKVITTIANTKKLKSVSKSKPKIKIPH